MPLTCKRIQARMQNALVITIGLLGLTLAHAAEIEPTWTRSFEHPINWQRVTAFGQLLVNTSDALYAVDPDTGEVRWARPELADLPYTGLQELAGSPLSMIDDGRESPRTFILNVFNGTLVFDSQAQNLVRIASTHLLPQSGALLVAGFEAGNPQPTLFLYDIDSGDRLWASDALHAGMSGLMRFMLTAALVLADVTPVQSRPIELDDDTFVLGAVGNVYRFERASGKVLWKTPHAGGTFELRLPAQRPDVVYVGAEEVENTSGPDGSTRQYLTTTYQGFRLSDGSPVWSRPVRFNQPMNRLIIPIEHGLIVSEGDNNKGRIQLLDYDRGESAWGRRGRGIDIRGQVLDYTFAGGDLILTTGYDSVWANKDTEYLLYVLDPAGAAFRFEEPLKVRGRMLATELTDKGLVYITTHEMNVFDPASGTLLNEPVLRSMQPLVTAHHDRLVYAFDAEDGFIYRFDRGSGDVTRFSQAPFAFPDRDRARSLDVTDGRVVLLGQQTVAAFGADGAMLFSVHHRAPRDPAWLRSLAWAEGIRAGMASAYAGAYGAAAASVAADAGEGSVGRDLALELQRGFGDLQKGYAGLASDYIGFARRRYEASAESRDFFFMMVQDDDRNLALAQVSKHDGRIVTHIDLQRDKEPDYQVDDVSGSIFYRVSDSAIAAYRFSSE